MKIENKIIVGARRLFGGVEIPNMYPFPASIAPGSPFRCSGRDSFEFVLGWVFSIYCVLRRIAHAKIAAAVVQSIAVAMIYFLTIFEIENKAVHPYALFLFVIIVLSRRSSCRVVCIANACSRGPIPSDDALVIADIDNSEKSSRQRDCHADHSIDGDFFSFHSTWKANTMALNKSSRLAFNRTPFFVRDSRDRSFLSATALAVTGWNTHRIGV